MFLQKREILLKYDIVVVLAPRSCLMKTTKQNSIIFIISGDIAMGKSCNSLYITQLPIL